MIFENGIVLLIMENIQTEDIFCSCHPRHIFRSL